MQWRSFRENLPSGAPTGARRSGAQLCAQGYRSFRPRTHLVARHVAQEERRARRRADRSLYLSKFLWEGFAQGCAQGSNAHQGAHSQSSLGHLARKFVRARKMARKSCSLNT